MISHEATRDSGAVHENKVYYIFRSYIQEVQHALQGVSRVVKRAGTILEKKGFCKKGKVFRVNSLIG